MEKTYSEQMLEALENQDLAQAQSFLEKALRKDDSETLAALGEQLQLLGFLDEAKRVFEHLLSLHPEILEFYLPLAEIAIENDKVDDAFLYLENISAEHPAYPESLLILADLYQLLEMPEVSEAKLQEAKQILPAEPMFDFALAELYFSLNRFQEAAEIYQQLLQKATPIAEEQLLERLGTVLSMLGEFEEAIPYLEQALERRRTPERLFQLAATFIQIEENQKAISLLQELLEMEPNYPGVHYQLAILLQEEQRLPEALEVANQAVKENPYNVDPYLLAAEIAYQSHDQAQSEQLLQEALLLGEKTEETLQVLSNFYLVEERYDEVISLLETAEIAENPHLAWNLAQAYNETEAYEKAFHYYKEAYPAFQHEPDFLREYGLFLREEGRIAESTEILRHYLAHVPDDAEIALLVAE